MRRIVAVLFVLLAIMPLTAQQRAASAADPAASLTRLRWRNIGPANMGGRVTDIVGVPGNPSVFYVAAADGGVFATVNGGATFEPIFDNQDVLSVGAIALAPSDPNVLWVGTGEGNVRNSASFGNGVYRSVDGGKNWTHLGLDNTERIARIRVDPRDPDTAYVAAMGHEWGSDENRGLYKTTDAGRTWTKILYANPDTGCSDVDIDASNPRILFAGMYTYRRRPWRFDGGGGETALYRSMDGGANWKRLTNGLPTGPMERVGVAISRSEPQTVYMITEAKAEGVLFRSDDRGESWRMVHDDPNINFRPFYYSDIRVDPNDAQKVFALGGGLSMSRDGGRTFERIAGEVHPDHHALWIDPLNPKRIINGNDGGVYISYDAGRNWMFLNNLVVSQYYHVNFDMQQPYRVCGGLQDNYNWCGPSATTSTVGIRLEDWKMLTFGDGFFAVPDLSAPHLVYTDTQGGAITLTDMRFGTHRSIHPYPVEIGSSGNAVAGYKYRFNWNAPIVLSPHDPKTVYFGGNVVFRSRNYGQSWDVLSPDLTTDDKSKQQSSGGPVAQDNTAAEFHCTILTVAESPVKAGVIWVGTDDGNIQITRDGGKTWTNVVKNVPGLPPNTWISTIEASRADAGTAYVAIDRHQDNDFAPYAFRTTDYGQTWTAIIGNLPAKGYVHVVREDPKNRDVLYAGTELGIYASWDRGARWSSIRNNMPPVAVRDLQVHPRDNDLILATHGRGLWILDDIAPIQQLTEAGRNDAALLDPRPAVRYQVTSPQEFRGRSFAGDNPPYGALLYYTVRSKPKDEVVITIADRSGSVVRRLSDPGVQPGINRVVWDLRLEGPALATSLRRTGSGGGVIRGASGGPLALAGEYAVKLSVDGRELNTRVTVIEDPRLEVPAADLRAQFDAVVAIRDLTSRANTAIDRLASLSRQVDAVSDQLPGSGASAGQITEAQALIKNVREQVIKVRGRLMRENPALSYRYPPKLVDELQSLGRAIAGFAARPTDPQAARLATLRSETDAVIAELNAIVSDPIAGLNRTLGSLPRVVGGVPIK